MNENLLNELGKIANDYQNITTSDLQGILMAIEIKYGIKYEDLYEEFLKLLNK